jgi:hypothetical protein
MYYICAVSVISILVVDAAHKINNWILLLFLLLAFMAVVKHINR